MVFCHHNAPIHTITALAKALAEVAKDKSRDENLFAYLVLESFDHVGRNLEKFLKERYLGDHLAAVLSGNTMDATQAVFTKIKNDESLPRRKVHEIVSNLQRDQARAKALIAEIIEHSNSELRILLSYFGDNPTSWLHIAELWDYIAS